MARLQSERQRSKEQMQSRHRDNWFEDKVVEAGKAKKLKYEARRDAVKINV